ncbi:hypothetical protein Ancab_038335 [Ancistrocladus abbreviatus]
MKFKILSLFLFFFICLCIFSASSNTKDDGHPNFYGSIVFNSGQRSNYNFDIYSVPLLDDDPFSLSNYTELKITDGISINFNGYFPDSKSSPFTLFSHNKSLIEEPTSSPLIELVYVTERNGRSSIYYDALFYEPSNQLRSRSVLEFSTRVQVPLLVNQE